MYVYVCLDRHRQYGAGRFVAAVFSPPFRRRRFVAGTLHRLLFRLGDTSSPIPFSRCDISSLEHEEGGAWNSPELGDNVTRRTNSVQTVRIQLYMLG